MIEEEEIERTLSWLVKNATPAAQAPAPAVAPEAAMAPEAAPGARRVVQRTQAYWARRVWVFLSKVRELKSVPKDEKRLGDPAIVQRWAA